MRRLLPLITITAAVAAAGCGAATPLNSADSRLAAQSNDAMLQFARCMRAHGVQMQDPFHRPGHAGLSIDMPEQSPATKFAYGACGHIMDPIIAMKMAHAPVIPAAMHVDLVRYAECMRTRGVPMLDPDRFGNLNLGNVPGMGEGFGRYTPQFHQADATCRHLLPASVEGRDNGTGP